MIILKRAGQPGQQMAGFLFSKMDFTRAQLGQKTSNFKDNEQDFSKHDFLRISNLHPNLPDSRISRISASGGPFWACKNGAGH